MITHHLSYLNTKTVSMQPDLRIIKPARLTIFGGTLPYNMNPDLDKIIRESYPEITHTVKYGYIEGVWLPDDYLEIKSTIDNFKIRDDDVWLCGLPKSGTTWAQEMVWCVGNDLDFQRAAERIDWRSPLVEVTHGLKTSCLMRRLNMPVLGPTIKEVEQMPSPRFLKSHLPYHLLPKALQKSDTKAKIIHVVRNPKDTCISSYHFYQRTEGFHGGFENFCELFLNARTTCTPYWEHAAGYIKHKDTRNILFIKYEDMKKDLASVIRKTAAFLNKSMNDDQIRTLMDHLSFETMKGNQAVNYEKSGELQKLWTSESPVANHMRKGEADQWKTEMSQEMIKKFNDWTEKKFNMFPQLRTELGSYLNSI